MVDVSYTPSPLSSHAQRFTYLQDHGIPAALFVHAVAEYEWDVLGSLLKETPAPLASAPPQLLEEPYLLIRGASGSGKTFVRFWLEKSAQRTHSQLPVIITDVGDPSVLSAAGMEKVLVEALYLDLFLAWLCNKASSEVIPLLHTWAPIAGLKFVHLCYALLSEPTPPAYPIWEISQRRVQLKSVDPIRRNQIQALLAIAKASLREPPLHEVHYNTLIQAIFHLGFQSIHIITDFFMSTLYAAKVKDFIEAVTHFQSPLIRLTMILPEELSVDGFSTLPYLSLQWNESSLKQILHKRVRSRHTDGCQLEDIIIEAEVDKLINVAYGSPRRLLESLSKRIETHLATEGDQLPIGQAIQDAIPPHIKKSASSQNTSVSHTPGTSSPYTSYDKLP